MPGCLVRRLCKLRKQGAGRFFVLGGQMKPDLSDNALERCLSRLIEPPSLVILSQALFSRTNIRNFYHLCT